MNSTISGEAEVPDNKEPKIYGPVDVARWVGGVAVKTAKLWWNYLPESGLPKNGTNGLIEIKSSYVLKFYNRFWSILKVSPIIFLLTYCIEMDTIY